MWITASATAFGSELSEPDNVLDQLHQIDENRRLLAILIGVFNTLKIGGQKVQDILTANQNIQTGVKCKFDCTFQPDSPSQNEGSLHLTVELPQQMRADDYKLLTDEQQQVTIEKDGQVFEGREMMRPGHYRGFPYFRQAMVDLPLDEGKIISCMVSFGYPE